MVRGSWLLVALPLLIAAFSVAHPPALPPPVLPPTFDGAGATALAQELSRLYPDRSPGSAGSLASSRWVADHLAQYGYRPTVDTFSATIPGLGRQTLRNVMVEVPGRSPERIVVMAHRDDSGIGPGANDNASGTAALIELARSYSSVLAQPGGASGPQHTILFLSTDAGGFGGLGAERFATSRARRHVVAVINLDSIASPRPARLEIAGEIARSPAAGLVETAAARVREQTGVRPDRTGFLGQLIDLAFPFSLYEQAPLVARDIPAITLTRSGDRPPRAFGDTPDSLDQEHFTELGRASQTLLESVDEGLELARGTGSYLFLGDRIVRGWAIELVLVAALLPFLAAAVDLFAFCRRHRIRLGPGLRSLRSRFAFWLFVVVLFELFALAGAFPGGAPRPVNPDTAAGSDWPSLALLGFAALCLAGWLIGRRRRIPRRPPTSEEELAGHTAALLGLAVLALLVVAVNPFSLLFLLPSLHAWLWLPHLHRSKTGARLLLIAVGMIGPVLLLGSFAFRFELGFDTPWYLAELAAIGYVPFMALLFVAVWLACVSQLLMLATGRYAPYPTAAEHPPLGPFRASVRAAVLGVRSRRRSVDRRRLEWQ
jgi:LPXTG-motif cell wall-anchored protein